MITQNLDITRTIEITCDFCGRVSEFKADFNEAFFNTPSTEYEIEEFIIRGRATRNLTNDDLVTTQPFAYVNAELACMFCVRDILTEMDDNEVYESIKKFKQKLIKKEEKENLK